MVFESSVRVINIISDKDLVRELENRFKPIIKDINGEEIVVYEINLRVPIEYKGSVVYHEVMTYIEIRKQQNDLLLVAHSDLTKPLKSSLFFSMFIAFLVLIIFNISVSLISIVVSLPIILLWKLGYIRKRCSELLMKII